MKRNNKRRLNKRSQLPIPQYNYPAVYKGSYIQQLPNRYPSAFNPSPNVPTNISYFSVQYSSDKLFASDRPYAFHWTVPSRFGEYNRGLRYILIRLVSYNIIRVPTYTGVKSPFYLFSDFGKEQDDQFIAYLTTDTSDNANGNTGKILNNIAGNIFVCRLYIDNLKKQLPDLEKDGIEDVIFRWELRFFNGN